MPLTSRSGRVEPHSSMEAAMASKAEIGGNGWRIARWTIPAGLLTVPLLAHFPWTGSDYVAMAILLFGSVATYEAIAGSSTSLAFRAAAAVAVATSFLLIWINLAAGIIGSETNPLNLLYAGVIGAALIGAIVARFEASGMARALVATAAVQALVGVVAVLAGRDQPPGLIGLIVVDGGFAALWLLSAALFRRAARDLAG